MGLLLTALKANAQISPQDMDRMNVLRDAAIRTWTQRVQPAFVSATSGGEAETIKNIKVNLIPYANLNAWAANAVITMPYGTLIMIDAVANAAAMGIPAGPGLARLIPKYELYLIDHYEAAQQGHVSDLQSFPRWANMPDQTVAEISQTDQFRANRIGLMVDSLAFIFGHEVGHIVLRHPPPTEISPQQSRDDEYAADAYGFRLAKASGFKAAASYGLVMPLFGMLEGGKARPGRFDTHPPALCRLAKLGRMDFNDVEADPDATSNLARVGMTLAEMSDNLVEMERACRNELMAQ